MRLPWYLRYLLSSRRRPPGVPWHVADLLPADLAKFYASADAAIRLGKMEDLVKAIKRFEPLAFDEQGSEAREFWDRLYEAAANLSAYRRRTGRLQSLWGVTPIVSIRYGAEADRRLGLGSETLVFDSYHIGSDFDVDLSLAQTHIVERHNALFYTFRRFVLAWALLSHDIFHIYNDRGLIEPAGGYGSDRFGIALPELESYRKAGKTLFTYAYGADHRMRKKTLSLAPLNFCMECPEPGKFCVCDDDGGERMLATISKYATRMIGWGLSVDLLPNPYHLNYIVVDPDELKPTTYRSTGPALKVGHFPNHGYFKGTHFLEEAIARLQSEGKAIELVQLSGVRREQVFAAMGEVDVVVDQLISGSFGLTAVEAMALGRPVIAHIRPGVRIAAPEECPVITATPSTIGELLERLVADRSLLCEAARRGPDYVRRYCSVDALSRSLSELYQIHIELPQGIDRSQLHLLPDNRRGANKGGRSWSLDAWRLGLQARWSDYVRASRESGSSLRRLFVSLAGPVLRSTSKAFQLTRRTVPKLAVKMRRRLGRIYARLLQPIEKIGGQVQLTSHQLVQKLSKVLGRSARGYRKLRNVLAGWFLRQSEKAVDRWIEWRIASSRRATERRLAAGKVRSLWGVTPILTLPLKARADRKLGFESKSLVFVTYIITRSFDINLENHVRVISRSFPPFLKTYQKIVFGLLLKRYDVFHFFFDRGVLLPEQRFGVNLTELDILRRAGKRVYVYAYGADVRLRQQTLAMRRWTFCTECPEPGRFCVCDDEIGSRTIASISDRVTGTVALGDMVPYVPGCRVLHYWPIDTDKIVPLAKETSPTHALKIAHAPNHTHFKGSHYLEATIELLRREGHAIDYVKVQGVPNSEVIKLFGEADIVADQFIGGGLGYTALEAMARGKPVLSYLPGPDFVEAPHDCPVINANPDTLEVVLRWMLENRHLLPAIGAQGRVYVEKWHSIDAVAERFGAMYEETAGFPTAVLGRIARFRREVQRDRSAKDNAVGWEHPFLVTEREFA